MKAGEGTQKIYSQSKVAHWSPLPWYYRSLGVRLKGHQLWWVWVYATVICVNSLAYITMHVISSLGQKDEHLCSSDSMGITQWSIGYWSSLQRRSWMTMRLHPSHLLFKQNWRGHTLCVYLEMHCIPYWLESSFTEGMLCCVVNWRCIHRYTLWCTLLIVLSPVAPVVVVDVGWDVADQILSDLPARSRVWQ